MSLIGLLGVYGAMGLLWYGLQLAGLRRWAVCSLGLLVGAGAFSLLG